ncbi:uncharacterized protein [Leuresthes tenuis]|uniref:uncharacterized protein n=1 Tax=Leuresthes tenuis TaxID=355514 RepID=UPI003B50F177
MMLNFPSVLCLSLLLFHTPFLLAKKGGGLGKSFSTKKFPTSNRGNTHTNTGNKHNQGSTSHGGYPKQPTQNNQGGNQGYPRQQGGGGYYNQYPARGSPYGGGYGSYGSNGGYPGGYINNNPRNKVLSPRYGGSFGYGGYGARGGSPFSQSVQAMGVYPNAQSKGFGRSAVMAAGGGAVAGMAVGYGLGRFQRPNFHFRNPQEEYYYNNYMYKKYGTQSSDTNDYSRDYHYIPPPQTYENYMVSCMKRTDILQPSSHKPRDKPVSSTTTVKTTNSNTVPSSSDSDTGSNSTKTETLLTSAPSTPHPLNHPEAGSVPRASQTISSAEDDTVSIVEIGYPALIEQLKAKKCVELYMVYSEKYLVRQTGEAQGLKMGFQGLLAVVISTILTVINSNILMLLH